jgi:hypothetical protein
MMAKKNASSTVSNFTTIIEVNQSTAILFLFNNASKQHYAILECGGKEYGNILFEKKPL